MGINLPTPKRAVYTTQTWRPLEDAFSLNTSSPDKKLIEGQLYNLEFKLISQQRLFNNLKQIPSTEVMFNYDDGESSSAVYNTESITYEDLKRLPLGCVLYTAPFDSMEGFITYAWGKQTEGWTMLVGMSHDTMRSELRNSCSLSPSVSFYVFGDTVLEKMKATPTMALSFYERVEGAESERLIDNFLMETLSQSELDSLPVDARAVVDIYDAELGYQLTKCWLKQEKCWVLNHYHKTSIPIER